MSYTQYVKVCIHKQCKIVLNSINIYLNAFTTNYRIIETESEINMLIKQKKLLSYKINS